MKKYRITSGRGFRLKKFDPSDTGPFENNTESEEEARGEAERLLKKLDELQEIFYADGRRSLLVILQAMDTGGKDGVIKKVFSAVDPQGLKIASFKVPTPLELSHDFLWRIHREAPPKGIFGIFNRSHYEDVLVTRVHGLVSDKLARRRFGNIKEFEKVLADNHTTILKFFLHISKDEQRLRFKERLGDPQKQWKFNPGDLKERKLWPKYMRAYEDAIAHTATDYAPWYVIPANRKWYRNYVVAKILVETLQKMDLRYPPLPEGLNLKKIRIE